MQFLKSAPVRFQSCLQFDLLIRVQFIHRILLTEKVWKRNALFMHFNSMWWNNMNEWKINEMLVTFVNSKCILSKSVAATEWMDEQSDSSKVTNRINSSVCDVQTLHD